MKRKNSYKRQSPSEIRKKIIDDLKKESDEMKCELLRQRLHHYNTIVKNPKNQ
jgi:ribosomal protein L29